MCWREAPLPSSTLASPAVIMEFWFSRGKREYQAGSNMENKATYILVKFKVQNPNCQQQCLVGGQSCNRLGCSVPGRNAACTARMAVVSICQSTLPTHPLWIRATSLWGLTEPLELLHLCKCRAQLRVEILKMWLFLQVRFQQNIPSELTSTGFPPSNGHPKEAG